MSNTADFIRAMANYSKALRFVNELENTEYGFRYLWGRKGGHEDPVSVVINDNGTVVDYYNFDDEDGNFEMPSSSVTVERYSNLQAYADALGTYND